MAYIVTTILTVVLSAIAAFFAVKSYYFSKRTHRQNQENSIKELEVAISRTQSELNFIKQKYCNSLSSLVGFPERSQMETRKSILENELRLLQKELSDSNKGLK